MVNPAEVTPPALSRPSAPRLAAAPESRASTIGTWPRTAWMEKPVCPGPVVGVPPPPRQQRGSPPDVLPGTFRSAPPSLPRRRSCTSAPRSASAPRALLCRGASALRGFVIRGGGVDWRALGERAAPAVGASVPGVVSAGGLGGRGAGRRPGHAGHEFLETPNYSRWYLKSFLRSK